jgi:tetratricopeptide (TPR) repeat protein
MRMVFSGFVLAAAAAIAGPAAAATVLVHASPARDCYLATLRPPALLDGDDGIAVCTLALATADEVDRTKILVNRSDIYLRLQDWRAAVADADAAIARDPGEPVAHLNRGAGLLGLKRYGEAIAALTTAGGLAGAPLYLVYYNLAQAHEGLGDLKGAYLDYKKVVEIEPRFTLASEALARFTVIRAAP